MEKDVSGDDPGVKHTSRWAMFINLFEDNRHVEDNSG